MALPGRGQLRRAVAAFFSRVMRTRFAQRHVSPLFNPIQQRLYRLTGGRFQISALLVPTLVLVSRGAKSGLRRETPLMCWPRPDGTFLIAGSNWGQPQHPAWTANLLKSPEAEITYKRRTLAVRAEVLSDTERAAAWPVLEAQWPHYRDYEKTAGRPLRVFRLVPTD